MLTIRGGPNVPLAKVLKFFVKHCHPVYFAALSAVLFFLASSDFSHLNPETLAYQAVYSSVFFGLVWTAFRIFKGAIEYRLGLENETRRSAPLSTFVFVIYLEIVKHVVGVSFTLGWIAGNLACWDYLGHEPLITPLAASLLISLSTFVILYNFTKLLDQLHWPQKDDN